MSFTSFSHRSISLFGQRLGLVATRGAGIHLSLPLRNAQFQCVRFKHSKSKSKLLSPAPRKTDAATASATPSLKVTPSKPEDVSIVKSPVPCWVDASPSRIAVLVGDSYKTFPLKKGWNEKGRDINWAETASFELLVQVLAAMGFRGKAQVKSDSATALNAVAGRKNRVKDITESVQRLGVNLKTSKITLQNSKVKSKANLADPFTRGKVTQGYREINMPITIPPALAPFVAKE